MIAGKPFFIHLQDNLCMNKPLITVGLTTFNAENTVDRALASIFRQTWRPVEIVAVDDCSSDSTVNILLKYASKYPELRIFSNPKNSGVAVSRNRIISEAKGKFVVFFDDDDESLPERIALQYQRIVNYESQFAKSIPVICHTARKVIYPDGETRIQPAMGQNENALVPSGKTVSQYILLGTPLENAGACPTCSQMARLSTYRTAGGFDPQLRRSEDTDFSIRLAEAGGHFAGIEKPLVIQTMTNTSEKSLDEEYRNTLLLLEKHRAILERAGQYRFTYRWLETKQAWLKKKHTVFAWKLATLIISNPLLASRRLIQAIPNLGLNLAFSRFHTKNK